MEHLDARKRGQADVERVGQPVVVKIFADAAGGIATHAGLRTVVVENTHRKVGNVRSANEHQTIAADALVAVAPSNGQFFGMLQRISKRIDINIIITCPVHFRKFYGTFHCCVYWV